jgi:hypothetical protein
MHHILGLHKLFYILNQTLNPKLECGNGYFVQLKRNHIFENKINFKKKFNLV